MQYHEKFVDYIAQQRGLDPTDDAVRAQIVGALQDQRVRTTILHLYGMQFYRANPPQQQGQNQAQQTALKRSDAIGMAGIALLF
ncbi:MAG: hypothetical protein Q8O65_00435, partial [Nitrosopumilaceae archaeon]|nr:hypothetical protein [Nitrosopumilaceae archaeon]